MHVQGAYAGASLVCASTELFILDLQAERVPRVLRKLQAGDRLAAGDKLESSNGLSTAILQYDGNFVVWPHAVL